MWFLPKDLVKGQAGVASSFRQGYAAAASMILFALVLVIGLTVQYLLARREKRLGF